jgi:catechol 2,3-dioxygenase-like lactoylglutathione lyase family enzyme
MAFQVQRVVPTFRMFSVEKAREFYVDFLGFKIDGEHRFAPDAPLFMEISKQGLALHLSEHHGDATPGSHVYVYGSGVRALHRELEQKHYRYNRPGVQQQEWGMTELTVIDPFGNRITFSERTETAADA